jgi:DNA-binding CsgD family transcriptional regulator
MIFRIIVLIVLCFSSSLFAQRQAKIDSLKKELSKSKMNMQRFHILNHLWNENINNRIEESLSFSEDMINLGEVLKIDTIIGFGLERKAVTYSYMNKFDSSNVYFNKALKIYKQLNDYKKIAGIERNLGQDHNMIGNLDSAYYYYDLAEKNYSKASDMVGIADIYNSKSIVYLMKGYYNLALENALKAEKIYTDKKLSMDLNQNRLVIASVYGEMKDTINAIDYHKKTLKFFENESQKRQYASTLNLILALQIPNKEKNEENEKLIDELVEISSSLKDESLIGDAQEKKAQFMLVNGNVNEAKTIFESLLNKNDSYSLAYVNMYLGETLILLKDYTNALEHLNTSKIEADKNNLDALKPKTHKLMSLAYQAIGNFENGLKHYKIYKKLEDNISSTEINNRFSELQTIYETEKKEAEITLQEKEIKTLNVQAENDKLIKTLYGIGMFSFLSIAALLYFGFKQRIKKNKIEREKQEEMYKQEIAFKKKELASQTLHLVQKNTFIQELKENLEKIKKSPELFKVEFRRLVMLLKKESAEDKDWEVFKSYFSEVHNNFDNKIKAIAKDITEKEIRLASFLRMNLSTKEIASMLNVLPDSVLKSKYRLKKKLELSKEDDLTQFLNTL